MKNSKYYAVIMAGGIGSRFWPVSTSALPKQFHDMLGSGHTLLQKTFARLSTIVPASQIQILTNERYSDLCLKQLPEITKSQLVLEPAMRNTAPCILLSALKIHKENPEALMLVAPSDHWIEDEEAFSNDVKRCFQACESDLLATLSIEPTFPNTGYGYIESGDEEQDGLKKVRRFCEKPDYETAKEFVASGNFVWNAGIFLWSTKAIMNAFETYLPEMYALFAAGMDSLNTSTEKEFVQTNYPLAENVSIDYGILEKAENVWVKKATFDWNDLGTWGALHEKLEKDEAQNSVVNAMSYLKNADGNVIFSASKKLMVIDGLKDYIVVDNDKVLLIFPKEKEQDIKKLVGEVNEKFGPQFS